MAVVTPKMDNLIRKEEAIWAQGLEFYDYKRGTLIEFTGLKEEMDPERWMIRRLPKFLLSSIRILFNIPDQGIWTWF